MSESAATSAGSAAAPPPPAGAGDATPDLTQAHYDWASTFCGVEVSVAAPDGGAGAAAKPKSGGTDAAAKTATAQATATKVTAMTDADIGKLKSGDLVALLKDLEAAGKPAGDVRKAQIKIFRSMKLDPDFKKREGERADKVADAVKDDADVKAGANDWASRTKDQRIAALKKVMTAQCKQLGIPTPPLETYDKAPSGGNVEDGNYDPGDGKMHFNINAGANKTFNDGMDTIVHETSHAYQHDLVQRLKDGKLKAGDADFAQAEMFAANDEGQDYIQPDEDMGAYVAQPEENHARLVAADYIDKIQKKLTGPPPAASH